LTEPFSFVPVNGQEIFSVARYFKKHWGLELLGDIHLQNDFPNPPHYDPRNSFSGGSAGVIYRFKNASTTPFVHVLIGGEIADGPHYQDDNWGPVGTVGGGMDWRTSLFKHSYGDSPDSGGLPARLRRIGQGDIGGIGNVNALRLSAGAVFHSGSDDATRAVLGLRAWLRRPRSFPASRDLTRRSAISTPGKAHVHLVGTGVSGNGETATVATGSLASALIR